MQDVERQYFSLAEVARIFWLREKHDLQPRQGGPNPNNSDGRSTARHARRADAVHQHRRPARASG